MKTEALTSEHGYMLTANSPIKHVTPLRIHHHHDVILLSSTCVCVRGKGATQLTAQTSKGELPSAVLWTKTENTNRIRINKIANNLNNALTVIFTINTYIMIMRIIIICTVFPHCIRPSVSNSLWSWGRCMKLKSFNVAFFVYMELLPNSQTSHALRKLLRNMNVTMYTYLELEWPLRGSCCWERCQTGWRRSSSRPPSRSSGPRGSVGRDHRRTSAPCCPYTNGNCRERHTCIQLGEYKGWHLHVDRYVKYVRVCEWHLCMCMRKNVHAVSNICVWGRILSNIYVWRRMLVYVKG